MAFRDELHDLLPPQPATGTAEQWAKESCEAVKAGLRQAAQRGEYHSRVADAAVLRYLYEIPYPFMKKQGASVNTGSGFFFTKKLQYWKTTTAVNDPQFIAYINTVTRLLQQDQIKALCVIEDSKTHQCKPVQFEHDTTMGEPRLCLLCDTTVLLKK